jgi:hypothetical protein
VGSLKGTGKGVPRRKGRRLNLSVRRGMFLLLIRGYCGVLLVLLLFGVSLDQGGRRTGSEVE